MLKKELPEMLERATKCNCKHKYKIIEIINKQIDIKRPKKPNNK